MKRMTGARKKYVLANKERIREHVKKHYDTHKAEHRIYNKYRRKMMMSAIKEFEEKYINEL